MFKERKLKTGKRNQRARWIYGKERSRKIPLTEPQGKLKKRPDKNAFLQSINAFLGKIEIGFLCLIVAMMLGLAILKIVMRYVFNASLLWSDVMLQHLTLWLCFFGAALATCERRHISIDVLNRILPKKITRWTNLVVDCSALIVVAVLAHYGFIFLQDEQLSEAVLIGSVPLWWAKAIIPYGFVLIGIHFALQIGIHLIGRTHALDAVKGESE